jgi:two-component system, OmpR family, response regulator
MRVLVVDDETKMLNHMKSALEQERYEVDGAEDALAALELAAKHSYHAIVLDVMLPGGKDGIALMQELRRQGIVSPILLASARNHVSERVEGLNAGADDYLPKPFALEELTARVNALVRRGGESRSLLLKVGDLVLDTVARSATRGSRRITLATREYRLLEHLMRNQGEVCSRRQLLQNVWDYEFDPGTNLVDVTIRRLREKIEHEGELPILKSVRGVGYMLRSVEPAQG